MFFRKPKAKFNVLNDIDSDLINLYLCVLDNFDELKNFIYWYPKSRSLHEMFRQEIKEDEPFTIPDVKRASKYYYTVRNSFNRIPTNAFSTHSDWDTELIKDLKFSRMKLDGATIENLDFKTLIERHSPREGDFYYLDPPYIVTEKRKDYYRNVLNRDKHIELKESVDIIDDNGGYVMISYDDHEVVRDLYSDRYHMNTIDTKYVGTMSDNNGKFSRDEIKTELLITNYKAIGQEELF